MDVLRAMNVEVEGAGDCTVVFANGFCTTRQSWNGVLSAVPAHWRVVRFDYIGNPGTPVEEWGAERYATLHGHADDVRQLLEALDVRNALFVGHSMSGMIGALVQSVARQRIGHLVMIGASPRYTEVPGEYQSGLTQADVDASVALADADLVAWMAGFAPAMLGQDASDASVQSYAGHILQMRPDVARQMIRGIFGSDHRGVLPHVTCPVTILQPINDNAVPVVVGEYLARHLPHATLRLMPTTGHLPHLTHSSSVARELTAIFAQLDAEQGCDHSIAHSPHAPAAGPVLPTHRNSRKQT